MSASHSCPQATEHRMCTWGLKYSAHLIELWSGHKGLLGVRGSSRGGGWTAAPPRTIQPLSFMHLPSSEPSHPTFSSVQFSSVNQLCPTLCDPMNHSTPGLPVHHQLPEFTQTHVHRVSDAIQPSHPLSSSSPSAHNPSQHQSLFQ